MPTRYILVNHNRPILELEAYLYTHTKIIGYLTRGMRQHTLLETTASDSADYFATYQADRLASGLFGVRVFETFEEAAAAMLVEAGRDANA